MGVRKGEALPLRDPSVHGRSRHRWETKEGESLLRSELDDSKTAPDLTPERAHLGQWLRMDNLWSLPSAPQLEGTQSGRQVRETLGAPRWALQTGQPQWDGLFSMTRVALTRQQDSPTLTSPREGDSNCEFSSLFYRSKH